MTQEIVLTPAGVQRLVQEIERLKGESRREIAERLRQALEMGHELAENADYLAVKEEQLRLEQRIADLEERLANARIVLGGTPRGVVVLGCHVRLQDLEEHRSAEYEIVGSGEGDPSAGRISRDAPVGSAVLGHRKGDIVEVEVPHGVIRLKILEVGPA